METTNENSQKAAFIFEQVFTELKSDWVGPEYDFDRSAYKAKIFSGDSTGHLVYISVEQLQDRDVSAEQIKLRLLTQIRHGFSN
jgi:hypothetical protein